MRESVPHIRTAWLALLALLAFCSSSVPMERPSTDAVADNRVIVEHGRVQVLYDFTASFGAATIVNAGLPPSASKRETLGSRTGPGIFFHTAPEGWVSVTYPELQLPPVSAPHDRQGGGRTSLYLRFSYGLREGVVFDENALPRCDGVQFSVLVNGVERLGEYEDERFVLGQDWRDAAIDLSGFAGKTVEISLRTHPVGGTDYDWAIFGDPLLIQLDAESSEAVHIVDGDVTIPVVWDTMREGLVLLQAKAPPPTKTEVEPTQEGLRVRTKSGDRDDSPPGISRLIEPHRAGIREMPGSLGYLPGEIERLGFYRYLPDLRVEAGGMAQNLLLQEQPLDARIRLVNHGRSTSPANKEVGVKLWVVDSRRSPVFGPLAKPLPELEPGEEAVLEWNDIRLEEAGQYRLVAELPGDGERWQAAELTVLAAGDDERAIQIEPEADETQDVLRAISTGYVRVDLPGLSDRLHYGRIWTRADEKAPWERVATIYPLAELVTCGSSRTPETHSLAFRAKRVAENVVHLHASLRKPYADVSVRLVWREHKRVLDVESRLQARTDIRLLRFAGPRLAMGDGTFGLEHEAALFGGLEYLGPDDFSSSLLDAAEPVNRRSTPHPRKVTVPLMAMSHGGSLLSTFWSPLAAWDEDSHNQPAATFDLGAPGSLRDYGLMQLSVPSIPEWRDEHSVLAHSPYVLEQGKTVTLKQSIYIDRVSAPEFPHVVESRRGGETVLAALAQYRNVAERPSQPEPPRDWETQKALTRVAWDRTIWDDATLGWRHCVGLGWPPAPSPGIAALLLFDAYTTDDPELYRDLTELVDVVIENGIKQVSPGYLWMPLHCHTMEAEYPFYGGYTLEAMHGWQGGVAETVRQQEAGGGWGWWPSSERHRSLGTPGEQTTGTSGRNVWQILRYTRVTGDERFLHAGLAGLKTMERDRVPRGAQGWECPLNAPDILAAAYAVRANVEAYRCTGNAEYLDRARYWAWGGLVFTYDWNVESVPAMHHATTPIFGATFFTHSWIGVPVNWCGLVYAYGLQELAEYDPDGPWLETARGIVTSTEWSQYEADHPSAGCFPDSYDLMLEKRFPYDINPEGILLNDLRLRGIGPQIKTLKQGLTTVSSGSWIDPAQDSEQSSEAGRVRFVSRFLGGRPAYTLVRPIDKPSIVNAGGRHIHETTDTQAVPDGWRYDSESRSLELKLTYGEAPFLVELQF